MAKTQWAKVLKRNRSYLDVNGEPVTTGQTGQFDAGWVEAMVTNHPSKGCLEPCNSPLKSAPKGPIAKSAPKETSEANGET